MFKWLENYKIRLFYLYIILSIVFFAGIILFYFIGPIEIAQICGLGLFWTVFGAFLNSVF